PSVSFEQDVVPILATNCALAACPSSKESNLGIHLTYDKDQLHAELQKSSPTPGFGNAEFVASGKPEERLRMAEMDGTQGELRACGGGCRRRCRRERSCRRASVTSSARGSRTARRTTEIPSQW